MKKFLITVAACALMAFCTVTAAMAVCPAGDANGDGKISAMDILTVKRYGAGISDDVIFGAADINKDAKLNAMDILLVKRYSAGIMDINELFDIEQFNISNAGLSNYDIVIDGGASENVKYAASELQSYLNSAFGTSLEIKDTVGAGYHIFIQTDDTGDLGKEGFTIKTDNSNLYIIGGTKRGALYGVYEFLESYAGYRFYIQDMEEFIASDEPIDVTCGTLDTQIPKIYYRDSQTFGYQCDDSNESTDYLNMAVKRKISSYKNRGALERSAKLGYGEGYTGTAHSFSTWIGWNPDNGNPCYNDPEIYNNMLNTIMARLDRDYSRGYPIDAITVSQEDSNIYCSCESCRAIAQREGSQAGVILNFVNNIADEVSEKYPDTYIWTLAYMDARRPPESMIPHDNVIICYAWQGCNNHVFTSDECTGTTMATPTYNYLEREYFEKWCEISDRVQVWYYPVEYDFMMAPCPLLFNIREDVAYLTSFDCVMGIYFEGNWGTEDNKRDGYGFETAQAYLETLVLWNPDMSEEEYLGHMMDFFRYYYGDGYEEVYQFALLQDAAADAEGCWINQWDYLFDRYSFDYMHDHFEEMMTLLDTAREKASTDEQRKHIDMLAMSPLFLGLSATLEDNYTNGDAESRALHEARYDRLIKIINDYNIIIGYKGDDGFITRGYKAEGAEVDYSEMPFWWYGLSGIHR